MAVVEYHLIIVFEKNILFSVRDKTTANNSTKFFFIKVIGSCKYQCVPTNKLKTDLK